MKRSGDARKDRLAAALRENLKRRKAKLRALENPQEDATSPPAGRPNNAKKTGFH